MYNIYNVIYIIIIHILTHLTLTATNKVATMTNIAPLLQMRKLSPN